MKKQTTHCSMSTHKERQTSMKKSKEKNYFNNIHSVPHESLFLKLSLLKNEKDKSI